MARWNSNRWVLALVAVLAVLAGNLTPVVGKRELVDSLQSTNPTEHVLLEIGGSPAGTWQLLNLIHAPITVNCRTQLTDLGTAVLDFEGVWFRQFGRAAFQQVFTCEFVWQNPSGPGSATLQQEFNIWEQDYQPSYLFTCTRCSWRIMEDGFYFQQTDGVFIREFSWKSL
ncbi:unnamed protein product [Calypogeia fissa]